MATLDFNERAIINETFTGEIAATKNFSLTLGDNSGTRTAAVGKKLVYVVTVNLVEVDA